MSRLIHNDNIHELLHAYFIDKNQLPIELRNLPIGEWDVSNITDMRELFLNIDIFNESLNEWDVSKVTNMSSMFNGCSVFNQPLNNWNVSKVTDMSYMFNGCSVFNQPLNNWNVSNVTDMSSMFSGCSVFNKPLNNWNVSKVTDMSDMFNGCSVFNQPLNIWNVSNVTDMSSMFSGCSVFNQPLNNWNVSKVTSMSSMFSGCSFFNQPLNNWNVSNVTNMSYMFSGCSVFNQPLNNWNVSNVRDMHHMFNGCRNFNEALNNPLYRPPQQQRQQPQPEPQPQPQYRPSGVAFEVHNSFEDLDIKKFMEIIRKKNKGSSNFKNFDNPLLPFITYINGSETKLDDGPKFKQKTRFTSNLSGPNGEIYKSINLYIDDHPDVKNDMLETIQFVLSQPQKYKDLYLESYDNECIKAYSSSGQTQSCVKGIFERIFTINKSVIQFFCNDEITKGKALSRYNIFRSGICKPVYIELLNTFYPDVDINKIFQDWYNEYSFDAIPEEQNPLTNKSIEERKQNFREYALRKAPNIVKLNKFIQLSTPVFDKLSIMGGRGKMRTRRIYKKNRKTRKIYRRKTYKNLLAKGKTKSKCSKK